MCLCACVGSPVSWPITGISWRLSGFCPAYRAIRPYPAQQRALAAGGRGGRTRSPLAALPCGGQEGRQSPAGVRSQGANPGADFTRWGAQCSGSGRWAAEVGQLLSPFGLFPSPWMPEALGLFYGLQNNPSMCWSLCWSRVTGVLCFGFFLKHVGTSYMQTAQKPSLLPCPGLPPPDLIPLTRGEHGQPVPKPSTRSTPPITAFEEGRGGGFLSTTNRFWETQQTPFCLIPGTVHHHPLPFP